MNSHDIWWLCFYKGSQKRFHRTNMPQYFGALHGISIDCLASLLVCDYGSVRWLKNGRYIYFSIKKIMPCYIIVSYIRWSHTHLVFVPKRFCGEVLLHHIGEHMDKDMSQCIVGA